MIIYYVIYNAQIKPFSAPHLTVSQGATCQIFSSQHVSGEQLQDAAGKTSKSLILGDFFADLLDDLFAVSLRMAVFFFLLFVVVLCR